jgi:hypothetical protein
MFTKNELLLRNLSLVVNDMLIIKQLVQFNFQSKCHIQYGDITTYFDSIYLPFGQIMSDVLILILYVYLISLRIVALTSSGDKAHHSEGNQSARYAKSCGAKKEYNFPGVLLLYFLHDLWRLIVPFY